MNNAIIYGVTDFGVCDPVASTTSKKPAEVPKSYAKIGPGNEAGETKRRFNERAEMVYGLVTTGWERAIILIYF